MHLTLHTHIIAQLISSFWGRCTVGNVRARLNFHLNTFYKQITLLISSYTHAEEFFPGICFQQRIKNVHRTLLAPEIYRKIMSLMFSFIHLETSCYPCIVSGTAETQPTVTHTTSRSANLPRGRQLQPVLKFLCGVQGNRRVISFQLSKAL